MLASIGLIRPETLELHKQYLRLERPVLFSNPISNPVWFIAFDPCPAFVIVQDPKGIKFRCPRDEIYLYFDDSRGEEITK